MTLRVGVAEHPLPDLGQQGEPRARLGLGLLGLGIFPPLTWYWAWVCIEGCHSCQRYSLCPVDCLTSPVPSALGEAGGQKPAWSVKMLHFLFLTGPGFRGHRARAGQSEAWLLFLLISVSF